MSAIERILAEVASFSKTMGMMHNDFFTVLRSDLNRFYEQTADLSKQQNWEGKKTIALTSVSAGFAVLGAFIPKANGNAGALDVRLNARDGLSDIVTAAIQKIEASLHDDAFLRSTCKTASRFFNGITPASDVWSRSKITEIEGRRSILERINIPNAQSGKNECDHLTQQMQNAASRILDAKSKG